MSKQTGRVPLSSTRYASLAHVVFGLLLCLFCWISASAAVTSPLRFARPSGFASDQLSTLALLQDRAGTVWIGTSTDGLYRFNGYQSIKYQNHPGDARALPNDRVSALFEDPEGVLWVGTQNGLARFNPEHGDFTPFYPDAPGATGRIIKAIISDGKQGMWIATWGGLQHFDPVTGKFAHYRHVAGQPDSLASDDLNALALDNTGGLWAATWPGGLDYLPAGATRFQHYRVDTPEAPDAKLNIVRSLHIDAQQRLWIGSENGMLRWQRGAAWDTRRRLDTPNARITTIYSDRQQSVWAGTLSAGLLQWEKGKDQARLFKRRVSDPYSIPSDDIRAILHDRSGMLWVASFSDGLALANLSSQGFARMIPFDPEQADTLANNFLQRIEGAPEKLLWLSSNTGLALFDPATGRILQQYRHDPKHPASLRTNIVYSLYQQADGPLWAGTAQGLHRLDGPSLAEINRLKASNVGAAALANPSGKFTVFNFGNVANDYINTISAGRDGILWLGTGNSMIRFQSSDGSYQVYRHNPADPHSRSAKSTGVILQDRRGRVWAGSEWTGGGLDLLDPATGHFTHFRHDPLNPATIVDENISSMYEDSKGRLWVGGAKGLNEILTDAQGGISFRRYTDASSIGQTRIITMTGDAQGKMWIATVSGLLRFDPDLGKVERFSASDGISEGFAGAVYKSPEGELYFGSIKGLTAVTPARVQTSSLPAQIAITDISVFNRSVRELSPDAGVALLGTVDAPTSLRLSHQATVFSVEFASLHYTEPEKNRTAYRLEGFDAQWVENDASRRVATYTNLDPGDYVFQLRAANGRGEWNPHTLSVPITILPAFWQTLWFRVLLGLIVLTMLVSAYRLRVRHLTRHQEKLETLVAERLSELNAQQERNRDTTHRLESILHNAADAILSADAHWRIESCNRAGLELYGWRKEQIVGMYLPSFCQGAENLRLEEALRSAAFVEHGQIDLELQQVRADQTTFTAEISLSAFKDGQQRKLIAVVRDITERQRVDKLREGFVSTVSHELRTPLTAIRGGLGLVANGVAGVLPEQASKLVRMALNSAERLTRLINDLLDVQKMEAGMLDFSVAPHDLLPLLQEALDQHLAYANRLQVRLALDADIAHQTVAVDADRFAQVMANLLSNACKYSPAGEVVQLRCVVLSAERVRIEVIDRGSGIPAQFASRIFQKFSQADASDTRAKEGTGLGLAIAKELVERMNGTLGFLSGPETGTVFFVELPLVESASAGVA